jgi:hypothetical protein
MIEESTSSGFGVFDVELALFEPDLCVGAGDNLAFEGDVGDIDA